MQQNIKKVKECFSLEEFETGLCLFVLVGCGDRSIDQFPFST